ncbi:MAG: SNF7 family protein, partial [Spirochaetales bacterium]|nr:SNF7 family protein [Spirochaetales bacterium]
TQNNNLAKFEKIEGRGVSDNPVNNPQLYMEKGDPIALWYNNIGQVVLAGRNSGEWNSIDIPGITAGELSNFCRFISVKGEMYIVWQSDIGGSSGLTGLAPDKTVPEIIIYPKNFRSSPLSQDLYSVTWNLPVDSSGIAGFSYSMDQDAQGSSPETIMVRRRDERQADFTVKEDGDWYIHVRAVDYAGNWSTPSTVKFSRDTTPPGQVVINKQELDEEGYLLSNTGSISWEPPVDEDKAVYSYRIQYIAGSEYSGDFQEIQILDTPDRPGTGNTSYSFYNQDNGIWAFTVSPFDEVGNKGEPETIYLRMNKYVPVTYVTGMTATQDDLGVITIKIVGRGFSVGGTISTIILDKDKKEPYDFEYNPETGFFRVLSDRIIDGFTISEMDEGAYFIGLIHPQRGLYFSREKLEFESTGTVKFGNFSILNESGRTNIILKKLLTLSVNRIFFAVIMLLMAIILIVAFLRITVIVREGTMIKMEVRALINNKVLPSEKRLERIRNMQKRGMGLRIKFALLVTTLVLIVVLMVSYSLGIFMISTQQKNLTEGLLQTTEVLINSVDTAAGKYLQENNTLELKRLPSQIESLKSARFLTITGPGYNPEMVETLWVTNDFYILYNFYLSFFQSNYYILSLLPGGQRFSEGSLLMQDDLTDTINKLAETINAKGTESVGVLSKELTKLQGIASELSRKARTEADIEEIRKMQDEISMISSEIEIKLGEIGDVFGSVPEFDPENIEDEYTFYRPIVYQQRGDNEKFYQGTVRLRISTLDIIREIGTSRAALVRRTVIIALIAIALGIVGALILASIIISPINHLQKKVEEIRDSVDHLELKNFSVNVKT